MKKIITLATLFITILCNSQSDIEAPKIFEPGVISTGYSEFNATFSLDGKTMYYSTTLPGWKTIAILKSKKNNGKWSTPELASFSKQYLNTDPFISVDGTKLFFSSDRPISDSKDYRKWDYKIWVVSKSKDLWGAPKLLEGPFNNMESPLYPSVSSNNNLYFSQNGNLFCSEWKNEAYQTPYILKFSENFNDLDPIISRNEEFLIFASSNRKGGFGGTDLWISFRVDREWKDPINLGSLVNSKNNEGQPGISQDNKTLFFSTSKESNPTNKFSTYQDLKDYSHSHSNNSMDIYHVNLKKLLIKLKSNF